MLISFFNNVCKNNNNVIAGAAAAATAVDDDAYRPQDAYLADAATSEYTDGFRGLVGSAVNTVNCDRRRLLSVLLLSLLARRWSTRPEQSRSFGHLLSENSVHRRPKASSAIYRVGRLSVVQCDVVRPTVRTVLLLLLLLLLRPLLRPLLPMLINPFCNKPIVSD